MRNLLNTLKENFKSIIEFLNNHTIKIKIQSKQSQETKKELELSNLFFIFMLLIIGGVIYIINLLMS